MKLAPESLNMNTASVSGHTTVQDHHLMELASLAIKARDAYKTENAEVKLRLQSTNIEVQRLTQEIEGLKAHIKRLESNLEDSESNNNMLQRMMRRMVKDAKGG